MDHIVESLINKYASRSEIGISKYGTTLEQNNKDNFLVHLQQELMDASLYIEKLIHLDREITSLVRRNPNDEDLGREIRSLVS
ncbi:hypothetical protein EBU91_04875 [bacterium]|nr:hypothetical protein [bacterium]